MKRFLAITVLGFCSSVYAEEPPVDCKKVSEPLLAAVVGKEVEEVLALVSKEVKATPKCACELIKSAIKGYKPKPNVVGMMVDTAIQAAPDQTEIILACAIAAAPDAREEISLVGAKYGVIPNPLDFPGIIGIDPNGQYFFVSDTPVFVNPPRVTFVDP